MKKISFAISTILMGFFVASGSALADDVEKLDYDSMSNAEVDSVIVDQIGYPEDYVYSMEESYKRDLIESYNEFDGNIIFEGREEIDYILKDEELIEVDPEAITPFAVIPRSDLTLSFDRATVTVSGVSYQRFYNNFSWRKDLTSIKNNRLGIALPENWQIRGGSGVCRVEKKMGTQTLTSNCGGRTMNTSVYGYSWDLGSGVSTGVNARYSGWVRLDARAASSNAIKRVVGEYARDTTSSGNSTISVSWGPASVSHTVSGSGKLDHAGVDMTW